VGYRIKRVVGIISSILILGACGGGGNSSPDVVPPAQPVDTTPTPTPVPEPAPRDTFDPLEPASVTVGHPFFNSPHVNPIVQQGAYVYAVNTPSDTLDVIEKKTMQVVRRIAVGVDPVAVAVRPDGKELWVSNHVSDSVSVIDLDVSSLSFHHVLATIQDFDPTSRSTRFDEPAGIAFASNDKAYVALSAIDEVAVIDVNTRIITKKIKINAQDPRAITVAGDKLFVAAFESNNQTELSGCFGNIDGEQCTFSLQEHVVDNNNVLSLFYDADIVKDPRVPDRDVFVFATSNEAPVDVISAVGTLLYGLTVTDDGEVFVSMTDARNHINGKAGTQKHTLKDLGNRAFLNQIGRVNCQSATCRNPSVIELEPLPPEHPDKSMALATPYGMALSGDQQSLIVTAAGSGKIFVVDVPSANVVSQFTVGAVPRGIALQSGDAGKPETAWVLNVVDNTVSIVDVTNLVAPALISTIGLEDNLSAEFKLGRALFNDASGSSTGTFSCESCHPDGHTDQLLWVLGGPKCDLAGCDQIPVRTTMPIRGARGTAPYHWDGVLGDPFGGKNGQSPKSSLQPNCSDELSCVRHLVDASMSSTMCDQDNCAANDEGKAGLFNAAERDALSKFILQVPPVPARERPFDDQLTNLAKTGFDDFFIKDATDSVAGQTCGSVGCHNMPFWTATNIGGSGMDAPSFRGIVDRWLVLPQGRVNMFELYGANGKKGFDEKDMWLRIISGSTTGQWQMFLEASMGYSGAYAKQVTLNSQFENSQQAITESLLQTLEMAADVESISLLGEGALLDVENQSSTPVTLTFAQGKYWDLQSDESYSKDELIALAKSGELILTLTAHSGGNVDFEHPQPQIWSTQRMFNVTKIDFPKLAGGTSMRMRGRHVFPNTRIYVDGIRVKGEVICEFGELPDCSNEVILVNLQKAPANGGMHLLQIQTEQGRFSNEFLFFK
jgi:YVTN family beta-propeller protein